MVLCCYTLTSIRFSLNPGCLADAILVPTPFYGVITEDVDLYSSVKLHCVPLDSEVLFQRPLLLPVHVCGMCNVHVEFFSLFQPSQNDDRPFHLTVEKLERALQKAKKEVIHGAQNLTRGNICSLACMRNDPACLFFFFLFFSGSEYKSYYPCEPPQSFGGDLHL